MLEGNWEDVMAEYESRVKTWLERFKKGGLFRRARLEKVPWAEEPWEKACRQWVLKKYKPVIFVHPLLWNGESRKPRPVVAVKHADKPDGEESTPAYYKALASDAGVLDANPIVAVVPFKLHDEEARREQYSVKLMTYPRPLLLLEASIITGIEDAPGSKEARAMEIDAFLSKGEAPSVISVSGDTG